MIPVPFKFKWNGGPSTKIHRFYKTFFSVRLHVKDFKCYARRMKAKGNDIKCITEYDEVRRKWRLAINMQCQSHSQFQCDNSLTWIVFKWRCETPFDELVYNLMNIHEFTTFY